MLAHDLAKWLLAGPNETVKFQLAHGLWSFEEAAEEYGRDHAREIDVDGQLLETVFDVQLALGQGPAEVRVLIGSNEILVEDLQQEAREPLGPRGEVDAWGTVDGRVEGILDHLTRGS